ncbi:MAG TPA: molybdenum cofactor guanylyltransferase [Candidatus Acidoferrum sp.]|nr:molybdenum cofactor guanylyltransferase [Candidatus Acidoferrum sp.]
MLRGVVLAGGRSSRMGRDKALLELEGATLLQRAVELLQHSGVDTVLVSGRAEHQFGVPDLLPHSGPPGALLSLLTWLERRGELDDQPLLLIPVDMPLLTPAVLQPLVAAAGSAGSYYDPQIFPCVIPASPALLTHLRSLFESVQDPGGPRSMRGIFGFLGSRPLMAGKDAEPRLANVNTPAEWRELSGKPGKYH